MKRFDVFTQAPVSMGQIIALVSTSFNLGAGKVAPIGLESGKQVISVHLDSKQIEGWTAINLRIEDQIEFDELLLAKEFSRVLRHDIITDLPEKDWADGFWLKVRPDGRMFTVWIDDTCFCVDNAQQKVYPTPVKNSHCSFCGAEYASDNWPRHCVNCKQDTWRNPLPVTVLRCVTINPVNALRKMVLVRRSIPPHIGALALPGGYLDFGETWQQGAARELFEETGTKVNPNDITLNKIITAPSNSNLLLFCDIFIDEDKLEPFAANSEVSEIVLATEPMELAFPTHTEMMADFFKNVGSL